MIMNNTGKGTACSYTGSTHGKTKLHKTKSRIKKVI